MRPTQGWRHQCKSGLRRATLPRKPPIGLPVTVPRLTASLQVTPRPNVVSGNHNLPGAYEIDLESLLGPAQDFLVVPAFQVLLQRSRRMQIHATAARYARHQQMFLGLARPYSRNSPLRGCGRKPGHTPRRAAHGRRRQSHPAPPAEPADRPGASPNRTCRASESPACVEAKAGMPKNGPTP